MAESTSAQPPPGSPPGGSWAFALVLTVTICLIFLGFVLVEHVPWEVGLGGVAVVLVFSAVVLRHVYSGQPLPLLQPKLLSKLAPYLGKFFAGGVQNMLQPNGNGGINKVIPGIVEQASPSNAGTPADGPATFDPFAAGTEDAAADDLGQLDGQEA